MKINLLKILFICLFPCSLVSCSETQLPDLEPTTIQVVERQESEAEQSVAEPIEPTKNLPVEGIDLIGSATPIQQIRQEEATESTPLNEEEVIPDAEFLPDEKHAYVIDIKSRINFVDTESWTSVKSWDFSDSEIVDLVRSADGSTLAIIKENEDVVILETATGEICTTFRHPDEFGKNPDVIQLDWGVQTLGLSPDGKLAISSDANHLDYFAWKTDSAEIIWRKRCPWRDESIVSFTPDGEQVLLWGEDAFEICQPSSGEVKKRIPTQVDSVSDAKFVNAGKDILYSKQLDIGESRRSFWGVIDVETEEIRWSAESNLAWGEDIYEMEDKKHVALIGSIGSEDNTIVEFRRITDGAPVLALKLRNHWTGKVSLMPDGKQLIVGNRVVQIPSLAQ